MARIGIIGSAGRMGAALVAAIEAASVVHSGGTDKDGDLAALAAASDVLVDFSSPAALEGNLDAAMAAGVPILIGTTGLEERHHWLCDNAAQSVAVLQTGNTSLGVTLLAHLVREAAGRLGDDWDIEVMETHHRMKVDAPSGTALLLGQAAAEGRAIELADHSARARDGITGARKAGDIGFASLRGGTVAGDHSVLFLGESERLTLSHLAEDRSIFARGAVAGGQGTRPVFHARGARPLIDVEELSLCSWHEPGGQSAAQAIVSFLGRIGLSVRIGADLGETFLPGLAIKGGEIVVDPAVRVWPGDLLHEAGHVAVTETAVRAKLDQPPVDGGTEMAAIAWSVAAAHACAIPLEVLFHSDAYKGGAANLVADWEAGQPFGVPLLAWYGMTSAEAFPTMTR